MKISWSKTDIKKKKTQLFNGRFKFKNLKNYFNESISLIRISSGCQWIEYSRTPSNKENGDPEIYFINHKLLIPINYELFALDEMSPWPEMKNISPMLYPASLQQLCIVQT